MFDWNESKQPLNFTSLFVVMRGRRRRRNCGQQSYQGNFSYHIFSPRARNTSNNAILTGTVAEWKHNYLSVDAAHSIEDVMLNQFRGLTQGVSGNSARQGFAIEDAKNEASVLMARVSTLGGRITPYACRKASRNHRKLPEI
jgi:hypothetical protein